MGVGGADPDPLDCFLKVVIFVKFLVAAVMQIYSFRKKKVYPTRRRFKDLHMQLFDSQSSLLSGVKTKRVTHYAGSGLIFAR